MTARLAHVVTEPRRREDLGLQRMQSLLGGFQEQERLGLLGGVHEERLDTGDPVDRLMHGDAEAEQHGSVGGDLIWGECHGRPPSDRVVRTSLRAVWTPILEAPLGDH